MLTLHFDVKVIRSISTINYNYCPNFANSLMSKDAPRGDADKNDVIGESRAISR